MSVTVLQLRYSTVNPECHYSSIKIWILAQHRLGATLTLAEWESSNDDLVGNLNRNKLPQKTSFFPRRQILGPLIIVMVAGHFFFGSLLEPKLKNGILRSRGRWRGALDAQVTALGVKKAQVENRNGFFFLFFTRFFRGPERTHNRNGSFFLFFTRFLGDLSGQTTETVPFFYSSHVF